MNVYDTINTSRCEIEDDIVESVLAHGTSANEFLANCGGSYDAAAKEIARFYTEGEDSMTIDTPVDQDGDELNIYRYAYRYFERNCPTE